MCSIVFLPKNAFNFTHGTVTQQTRSKKVNANTERKGNSLLFFFFAEPVALPTDVLLMPASKPADDAASIENVQVATQATSQLSGKSAVQLLFAVVVSHLQPCTQS